jgi:hypothetical protein
LRATSATTKHKKDLRSCVIQHHNTAVFACGSMVLAELVCAVLRRYAPQNRTPLKTRYRSAEGTTRQLRKF